MPNAERERIRNELVASGQVSRQEMSRAAERLGWQGFPGDFGNLTVDRVVIASTGDPRIADLGARFGTSWPCAAFPLPPTETCGAGGVRSIFCSYADDCSDRLQRADENYRLARAVTTLAVFSGFGVGNLELPLAVAHDNPRLSGHLRPGAEPTPVELFLDDGSTTATSLDLYNTGGWDTAGADMGGRLYILTDSAVGSEGVTVWSGRASGRHIDPASGPGCIGEICELSLVHESEPIGSTASREYNGMLFSNFGNNLWRGDEGSRSLELDRLWIGTSPARPGTGAVFEALYSPVGGGAERFDNRARAFVRPHTDLLWKPMAFVEFGVADSRGNFARVFDYQVSIGPRANEQGITNRDILDALELGCYANSEAVQQLGCGDTPPALNSEAELPAVRRYLQCLASDLERSAEYSVVQNIPALVVDGSRGTGASVSPLEGEFGRAVSGAREVLLSLREQPRGLAVQLRGFETDLSNFEIAIRGTEIRSEIIDWRAVQGSINASVTCAQIAESKGQAGYAACGAALSNLAISFRIDDLEREALMLGDLQTFNNLRAAMEARVDALQRIGAQVTLLVQQLDGHLAVLNSAQLRGRTLLGDVMFTSSVPGREHLDENPFLSPTNAAMRRRYTTTRERYDRAFWRATRSAVLARRAIEQRLGLPLGQIPDDDALVLLDRPASTLAVGACEFDGLDYEQIRDEGWRGSDGTVAESYSDGFIGDYVRDLRALIDSYPYAYPYTDGTDVAVVSLRDDILNVRASCREPLYNALPSTNNLLDPDFWTRTGCDPGGLCIGVRELTDADAMPMELAGPLADFIGPRASADHAIQGYRFEYGENTYATSEARYSQTVPELEPGTYRISWYGRVVGTGPHPQTEVEAFAGADAASPSFQVPMDPGELASGWARYFCIVDHLRVGDLELGVAVDSDYETELELAGLMVESVTIPIAADSITQTDVDADPDLFYPRPFISTDSEGGSLSRCEDTDGTVFRDTAWDTGCDRLCSGGFEVGCVGDDAPDSFCYWQTTFDISQDEIERGVQLANAGFAYGNFNYRIERVGVNVVGRRDCEGAESPSTCFALGGVPFSLYHDGPFNVSNHLGGSYDNVPLFNASIDHGRALATERYITNPISGADSSLLASFMRDDFNGRPLDGQFRFRIWDTEGTDFSAIEDVQLIIHYRYWNRSRTTSGD